jgi:hypothetical protein
MKDVRRGRVITAILATLVAGALATTAPGDAHAAPGAGTGARAAATTKLHLHVTGCDHCSVRLQQAVEGRTTVWQSRSRRVGNDHTVTFTVPSRRTHGMSFTLHAPWQVGANAIPNIVTRYRGHSVDSLVGRKAARRGKHAEGCWAGTTLNDVSLNFHVARVAGETATGDPTPIPLVYATHTMSSWRPMVDTFKGTIANQDAFWCKRPPTTTVTFATPGCAGCELQLLNGALRPENLWISRSKTVATDSVAFDVPRPMTRGLSATVHAPWEGAPPFTTDVVWRYAHHQVGDAVTFSDARSRSRASGCWGGSTDAAVSVALTVRQVTVRSTTGDRTPASIAFAEVTQPWLRPMLSVRKGVLGSQDVLVCKK